MRPNLTEALKTLRELEEKDSGVVETKGTITPEQVANKSLSELATLVDQNLTTPEKSTEVSSPTVDIDPRNFTPYIGSVFPSLDIEEQRAQAQSTGEQIAFGATRLVGTAATKLLEGVGFVGGGLGAMFTGNIDTMTNNGWVNMWANAEEHVKEAVPIFKTNEYKEGNVFAQMGTMAFWTDDVVDGLAFLASAYVPGLAISKLGIGAKAASGYGKFAKSFSTALRAEKLGKVSSSSVNLSKLAKTMDLATITAFTTTMEAGFEARDTQLQVEASLRRNHPELTDSEIKEKSADAALGTFWSNMTVLALPNALEASMLFKTFKGSSRAVNKIGEEMVNTISRAKRIKTFGWNALSTSLAEGAWEENIQLAIQNFETQKATTLDKKDQIGRIEALAKNWINNFSTDEGQKAIALGSIIGFIPGGIGGTKKILAENERQRNLQRLLLSTIATESDLYKRKIVDGVEEVELDKNGNPKLDTLKVQKAFVSYINSIGSTTASVDSVINNNPDLYKQIRYKNLARIAYPFLRERGGLASLDSQLQALAKEESEILAKSIESEEAKDTEGFADILYNDYKAKTYAYQAAYDAIAGRHAGFTSAIDEAKQTKETKQFNEDLIFVQYTEAITQANLNELKIKLQGELAAVEAKITTLKDETGSIGKSNELVKQKAKLNRDIKDVDKVLDTSYKDFKDYTDFEWQRKAFKTRQKSTKTSEEVSETYVDSTLTAKINNATTEAELDQILAQAPNANIETLVAEKRKDIQDKEAKIDSKRKDKVTATDTGSISPSTGQSTEQTTTLQESEESIPTDDVDDPQPVIDEVTSMVSAKVTAISAMSTGAMITGVNDTGITNAENIIADIEAIGSLPSIANIKNPAAKNIITGTITNGIDQANAALSTLRQLQSLIPIKDNVPENVEGVDETVPVEPITEPTIKPEPDSNVIVDEEDLKVRVNNDGGLINLYLRDVKSIELNTRDSNDNIILTSDQVDSANAVLSDTGLKEGDTVTIVADTEFIREGNTKPSVELHNRVTDTPAFRNELPLKLSKDGKDIGVYINEGVYLKDEEIPLTERLIEIVTDGTLKDIKNLKRELTIYNKRQRNFSTFQNNIVDVYFPDLPNINEKIHGNVDSSYNVDRLTSHILELLKFDEFKKAELIISLNNWLTKIRNDYANSTLVHTEFIKRLDAGEKLEDIKVVTTIGRKTTGNLVIREDKGINNLYDIFDETKGTLAYVPPEMVERNALYDVNTNTIIHTNNEKEDGYKGNTIYWVTKETPTGKNYPTVLTPSLISDETANVVYDRIIELINLVTNEDILRKDERVLELENKIADHVYVNKDSKSRTSHFKINTNIDNDGNIDIVEFTSGTKRVIITSNVNSNTNTLNRVTLTQYNKQNKPVKTVVANNKTESIILRNEAIKLLKRKPNNINYINFKNEDGTINGKALTSEINSRISDGRLGTKVGKLLDNNGDKISNFKATGDRPLILAINTNDLSGIGDDFEGIFEDTPKRKPKVTKPTTTRRLVEKEPKEATKKPKDNLDAELDNLTNFRLASDTPATEAEDISTMRTWWDKVLPNVPVDFDTYKELIYFKGQKAYGMFHNNMAYISEQAEVGTTYHEAFHAVFNLFLNDSQRITILDEASKIYGIKDTKALEELLAQDFANYNLGQRTEPLGIANDKLGTKIKKFFSNLLAYIKLLMGKRSVIDEIYSNINKGRYKHAIPSDLKQPTKLNESDKTLSPNMDSIEEEEQALDLLVGYTEIIRNTISGKQTKQLLANQQVEVEDIRGRLVTLLTSKTDNVNVEQKAFLDRIIKDIEDTDINKERSLWFKTKDYINRILNVKITEVRNSNTQESNPILTKLYDDSKRDTISTTDNLVHAIKRHIATTPKLSSNATTIDDNGIIRYDVDYNTLTGQAQFLDYTNTINYLKRFLTASQSPQDLIAKLEDMSVFNPSLIKIANDLKSDDNLLAAWFSQSALQAGRKIYNHINVLEDGTMESTLRYSDKSHQFSISDEWVSTLTSRIENNVYDIKDISDRVKQLNISITKAISDNTELDLVELYNITSDIYTDLGITIEPEMIHISVDKKVSDLYTELSILHSTYINPLSRIVKDSIQTNEFNNLGDINKLAIIAAEYDIRGVENSFLNVEGSNEYLIKMPNYISDWFKKYAQPVNGKPNPNTEKYLKLLATLPDFKYSNWIWNEKGELDVSRFTNMDYNILDGNKSVNTKEGQTYNNIGDQDWKLTNLLAYLDNPTGESKDIIRTPSIILSDSSQAYYFKTKKIKLNSGEFTDGRLNRDSNLWKAVYNTAQQEIARMTAARDLLFKSNDNEEYEVRDNLPPLQVNYHFSGEYNIDGKPIVLNDDGTPTGNVFKFQNIPELNNVKNMFYKGIISDIDRTNNAINNDKIADIKDVVDDFIDNLVTKGRDQYRAHATTIKAKYKHIGNYGAFMHEYLINQYVSLTEQQLLWHGVTAEFKSGSDTNKRAKEISAPGLRLSGIYTGETFNVATVKDIILRSSILDEMTEALNEKLSEDDVQDIVNEYRSINTADAQGFCTVDRYVRILKDLGKFDGYTHLINETPTNNPNKDVEYTLRDNIPNDQLSILLQPLKPFYYNRYYDTELNKLTSSQIKYSVIPMIPTFIKDTQLETINNHMIKNNIDELIFESAEKVGSKQINSIVDENGKLETSKLNKLNSKPFSNSHWRQQQEVPDHIKDTVNKAGVQIYKLIIANIPLDGKYEVNGKAYSGQELIDHYQDLISNIVTRNADKLLKRLEGKDSAAVQKILMSEAKSRGFSNNDIESIRLNRDGDFNLPLFFNAYIDKWMSVLGSLFTNKITNLKVPGMHAVLASTIFSHDLNIIKDNKGQWVAEVAVSPWSDAFYDKNGKLMDIADIPEDVKTMIGYRIPYSTKHSSVIIKVVKFLPRESGSVIQLPHDMVVRMGSDFDVDSMFVNYHNIDTGFKFTEEHRRNVITSINNMLLREFHPSDEQLFSNDEDGWDDLTETIDEAKESFAKSEDDIKSIKQQFDKYVKSHKEDGKITKVKYDDTKSIDDNTDEAIQNEILDTQISIQGNDNHLVESFKPAMFNDTKQLAKDITTIVSKGQLDTNPVNPLVQDMFRGRGMIGKHIIPLVANSNTALSVMQVTKSQLTSKLDVPIRYELKDLNMSIEELNSKYGAENVHESDRSTVIIRYNTLGWNQDGSYTNINNKLITDQLGQLSDHAVDNVKDPLPPNINRFTYSTWLGIVMPSGDIDFATYFVHQPIIQSVTNRYYKNEGIAEANIRDEVDYTKGVYQANLLALLEQQGKVITPAIKKRIEEGRLKGLIPRKAIKGLLGYDPDSTFTYTTKDLIGNLEYRHSDNFGTDLENDIKYYRTQLKIVEMYKRYNDTGKAIGDAIQLVQFDKAINTSTDTLIGASHDLISKIKEEGNIETIRITIDGEPFVRSIYPKVFDSTEKSSYPILQTYLYESNVNAINTISPYFITESTPFVHIKDTVTNSLGGFVKSEKSSIMKKLNVFLLSNMISRSNKFNINDVNINQILGIEGKINLNSDIAYEDYIHLSTANKLRIVKDRLALNPNATHILNNLEPQLTEHSIDSNGFHFIKFANTKREYGIDNRLTITFNNMYYSDDVFQQDLAKELIEFSRLTFGLGFANQSFSKLIPVDIWNSEDYKLGEYLHEQNNKETLNDDPLFSDDVADSFILNNPNVIPTVKGRSNESNGKFTRQWGTPSWKPNKFGYIYIPNIPDNVKFLSNKIANSQYVKHWNNTTKEFIIYKKYTKPNNSEDNIIYYPVNRLGNWNLIEFGVETKLKKNKTAKTEQEHIDILQDLYGIDIPEHRTSTDETENIEYELNLRKSNGDRVVHLVSEYNKLVMSSNKMNEDLTNNNSEYRVTVKKIDVDNTIKYVQVIVPNDDQFEAIMRKDSPDELQAKIDHMRKIFKDEGLDIKVVPNYNLSSNGRVVMKDDKPVVEFNPLSVRDDTIFHEFGHIFIDILGVEHSLVKEGINSLKGTKLYNDIKRLYPHLNEVQLNKEVLTTAIGIEANKIFIDPTKANKFKEWIKRLFAVVRSILGISNTAVNSLANKLIKGDLNIILDRKFDIEEQHQIDERNITNWNKTITFISQSKQDLINTIKEFGKNTKSKKFVDATQETVDILSANLEDAINEQNATTTYEALLTTANYNVKLLDSLELKLDALRTKYVEGNINLADVDWAEQRSFTEQLNGTRLFLATMVKIDDLEYLSDKKVEDLSQTEKDINELVKELKNYLPRISNLQSLYDSLVYKHVQMILDYSDNPEGKRDAKQVLAAMDDINWWQLKFDGLYDANNPIGSNLKKLYTLHLDMAETEVTRVTREFHSKTNEYLKGISDPTIRDNSFNKLIDDSGRWLREWDYDKFSRDRIDMFDRLSKAGLNGRLYNIEVSNWYNKNTTTLVVDRDRPTLINKKRKELSHFEFMKWRDKTFRYSGSGRMINVVGGDFAVPNNTYKDSRYEALTQKDLEYLKYVAVLTADLVKHYSGTIEEEGYVPAVEELKASRAVTKEHQEEQSYDVTNEEVWHIPFRFISKLNQIAYIKIPKRLKAELLVDYEVRVIETVDAAGEGKFDSIEAIEFENSRRRDKNRVNHKDALDHNLARTIPLFIDTAVTHKHKKEVEADLKLTLATIKNAKFKQLNGWGKTMLNRNKIRPDGTKDYATIDGGQSNLYNRVKKDFEMVFYEKFLKEGKYNKLGTLVKQYNSIKGIGFNPFSAFKNLSYGTIQSAIEAGSGSFFNKKNVVAAAKLYTSGILSYSSDTFNKDGSASTLANGIIKDFNILQDQSELNDEQGGKKISQKKIKKLVMDAAYYFQHTGEHLMQNQTLFAMMDAYRIVDGKIININDYVRDIITKTNLALTKEENKAIIAENKAKRKDAETKFETYPKVIDSYELATDGYAELKKTVKLNSKELSKFKIKVKGVNHKIHGIYNPEDKGTMENTIMGQLLMQFRHWARPGWNKRFGTKGEPVWNERRGEFDIGDYKSFFNLLTIPFSKESKDRWTNPNEQGVLASTNAIIKGYIDFATKSRIYWHNLNEWEKAGVRRTLGEMLSLATVMLLLGMLKGIVDDDERYKDDKMFNFLLYQLDATRSELLTYAPVYGWINEGSKLMANPMATWGTFVGGLKLLSSALEYPFIDDEARIFRGGMYNNETKVKVYSTRLVPAINQWQRWTNIASNNQYYKLW